MSDHPATAAPASGDDLPLLRWRFLEAIYDLAGGTFEPQAHLKIAQKLNMELRFNNEPATQYTRYWREMGLVETYAHMSVALTAQGLNYVRDEREKGWPQLREVAVAIQRLPRDYWPEMINDILGLIEDRAERINRGE